MATADIYTNITDNVLPPLSNGLNITTSASIDAVTSWGCSILAGVAYMVCFACFVRRYVHLQTDREEVVDDSVGRTDQKDIADTAERRTMIETCMVTKCVVGLDEDGSLILGDNTSVRLPEICEAKASAPMDDDASNLCSICLDAFQVGDTVAWPRYYSKNHCLHVFHSACIFPWLENANHNGCPSCRRPLLLVVSIQEKYDEEAASQVKSSSQGRNRAILQRANSTDSTTSRVLTIVNGLISNSRRTISD